MPYDDHGHWGIDVPAHEWTRSERRRLEELEDDLCAHMAELKPRRFEHSLSVARTARDMALVYDVDPFAAYAAGVLHDWDKVLGAKEQLKLARKLGIDLGVDLELVQPLLHGMTAARHLPQDYPDLPADIWQAIERHTLGAADMGALDMVVFVADGIEPLRADVEGIHAVRELVDACEPLDAVFWASFAGGIQYVIDTERYLYPGALDIYNELVLRRRTS